MANKLARLFRGMVYVLPGVLFFSYQPLIHFGASESMNFELSLPLIWLVLFGLLILVMGFKKREFWRGIRQHWAWLLLPLWLSLSVLWSLNSLRGLLTVGILWLIYFAGYGIWHFKSLFSEAGFREKFWRVFFGSSLVACAWCWLQCVLDLAGVPREASLMCAGCTYQMFGFPHPCGFAIEPQFMGNLLLAPLVVSGYFAFRRSRHLWVFFALAATLFLTFSRGAIYAFVIAAAIMTVWAGVRQKSWHVLKVPAVIAGAFALVLGAQGIMSAVSPTSDTFQSGVAKVLNHLTLGVVDIREPASEGSTSTLSAPSDASLPTSGEATSSESVAAAFDGYVAESTDTRLRLSGAAAEVWRRDFATAMFGVGLGGAGQALYINGLSPAPKEIVQNQYISLLLESGLIGVALFILTLVFVVKAAWQSPWRVALVSLLVAYGVSLLFFSGLPNALQIYLLPPLLFALAQHSSLPVHRPQSLPHGRS